MGGVLTAGFRLATQMKDSFAALQVASALQWQPALIAQQLTSLRDRLESRAYAGQTLVDLKDAIETFDRDLEGLAGAVRQPGGGRRCAAPVAPVSARA